MEGRHTTSRRVSVEELSRTVDGLVREALPYSSSELRGMIADFAQLESYGFEVRKTKKTGDARNMLDVQIRPTAACAGDPLKVLESCWIEFLALSGGGVHTVSHEDPLTLRFVTSGMAGFITGTIAVQEKA